MNSERAQRRLAAILVADVAGYSRLMGADEEGTHERLKVHLSELINPKIGNHHGRIVKNTGDGFLAEFASVVDAVRYAVEVQGAMAARNENAPVEKRIDFRMGINLGDILIEDDDIFGDGVNIAARIEGLALPGGICISRTVRDQVRDRLSLTLEDMGELEVKNIARPVRAFRIVLGTSDRTAMRPLAGSRSLSEKPSIAVMPFQNMSGDAEQEYFADGMVEEIITALSRIPWLFVIARNSTFTYKGQLYDVKQVGRELGVRYILEGSVRKASDRVRITAQLVDAESAGHLWADRFDGSLEDIFQLQDNVALSVSGVIEPALHAAETARVAVRPTHDLTAYDLYLRTLMVVITSAKGIPESLRLLNAALTRDPNYGPALALAAICHMRLISDGTSGDPQADRSKSKELGWRALEAAAENPVTIANAALALAFFDEDIHAMIALVDRAVTLNPSFARGWYTNGTLHNWAGLPEISIERTQRAIRLSPRGRIGNVSYNIGLSLALMRRFEEAAHNFTLEIQSEPQFPGAYRWLAACYAHMGSLDKAAQVITNLRRVAPRGIEVIYPNFLRKEEHREIYVSGLKLAVEQSGTQEARE